MTDPYPPAEERSGRTRVILEVLGEREGFEITITTRSNLVTRDLDLLVALADRHRIAVHVMMTTLDRRLSQALEPDAPRPDLRLKTISVLAAVEIPVGLRVAPVLPDLTDDPRALDRLAAAAAAAGAHALTAHPVILMPLTIAVLFPHLEEAFPDLVDGYRRSYERKAYLPEPYAGRLAERVRLLHTRHGFGPPRESGDPEPAPRGPQLALF
ncbi:MAG TPA: hypothetical protein VM737_11795 [Gemmatimonadota bacterium]|nr:hypothetical protein [Gemmatimonadota bacterium]